MQGFARVIYALSVALLVAMTVGFGLVTFYPEPDPPEYPISQRFPPVTTAPAGPGPGATPSPEEIERLQAEREAQIAYEAAWERHQDEIREHHRTALAIATVLGLLALIAGAVAAGAPDALRAGIMLGGLFTIVWGLIYAASEAESGTMFVAALLALIALGSIVLPPVRNRLPFADSADELLGRR